MNNIPFENKIAAGLFLASLVFSCFLLMGSKWTDSAGAILYSCTICFVFAQALRGGFDFGLRSNRDIAGTVLLTNLAIAIGLLLPTVAADKTHDFFWVHDSLVNHVPRAEAIANWLHGEVEFPFSKKINIQGAITHFLNGVIFYAFEGASPVKTTIVLAVLRACTCFTLVHLCRELFKSKRFDVVYLAYALYPNALYHTTTFYKEATVHLTVALTFFFLIKLMRKPRFIHLALLLGSLIAMFLERYYLTLIFLPLIAFVGLANIRAKRLVVTLAMMGILAIAYMYHPYFEFDPQGALARLLDLRRNHSQLDGIDYRFNYGIPYPAAVIKTLFTPFWTPSKIEVFRNFSSLITWGSFVGHFFILAYLLGVGRAVRRLGWQHCTIQLPALIFVLLVAYISPWAGRVRDSICPLFAIYATYYFVDGLQHDLDKIRNRFRCL